MIIHGSQKILAASADSIFLLHRLPAWHIAASLLPATLALESHSLCSLSETITLLRKFSIATIIINIIDIK